MWYWVREKGTSETSSWAVSAKSREDAKLKSYCFLDTEMEDVRTKPLAADQIMQATGQECLPGLRLWMSAQKETQEWYQGMLTYNRVNYSSFDVSWEKERLRRWNAGCYVPSFEDKPLFLAQVKHHGKFVTI